MKAGKIIKSPALRTNPVYIYVYGIFVYMSMTFTAMYCFRHLLCITVCMRANIYACERFSAAAPKTRFHKFVCQLFLVRVCCIYNICVSVSVYVCICFFNFKQKSLITYTYSLFNTHTLHSNISIKTALNRA